MRISDWSSDVCSSDLADWDPATNYHKDNTFYQASLRGDYDLTDDITFTSVTAWSRASIDQNNDVDGTALPSSDIAVVGKITSFSTEARLSGDTGALRRSAEHTYELQSLMRISYDVLF